MNRSGFDNWFAAQLKPNGLGLATVHLARQGFATFCPTRLETRMRRGQRVPFRKPLFPGYIFVNFDPAAPGWPAINSTRGIARLIVQDRLAAMPLPPDLMAGLMSRCDEDGLLLPPSDLEAGDRVRVLSGPFADFITRIEDIRDDQRLGVLIELMGRKVQATLPREGVAKL